ncbi:MAG: indolepyruvate oxidoreductase subunit beta [Bacteroidota bacterium]
MKTDIILCGVGGQGILSIAAAIGLAALDKKLKVKQAEVHGMSQRGGAVQSHLRLSDRIIASDLIPYGGADIILSVEPMESLRYLPYLSPDGWLLTNTATFENIPNYPETDKIQEEIRKVKKHVMINADEIAREAGSLKASNMVMLGAGSFFTGIEKDYFTGAIEKLFKTKGEDIINMNILAFEKGENAARNYRTN